LKVAKWAGPGTQKTLHLITCGSDEPLPDVEGKALAPHLTRAEMKQHQILFDVRDTISDVYFAIDAVVSLVIPLATGGVVETAMVGRDSVVGSGAALNGRVSLDQVIVQVGGHTLRCPAEHLKDFLQKHSYARSLMGAHRTKCLGAGG
jgi:CRP-like cAMP-binding protein